MASDANQRKRHRALDILFRRREGFTVLDIEAILNDEFHLKVSERTIKTDIKLFKEYYKVPFDEDIPKDGKAKRYRYSDGDFTIMDCILSEEDKNVIASLLKKIRGFDINPNFVFFISLLEYVVTHQTTKGIELDAIQFSNNAYLRGLEDWFRPLMDAIIQKKAIFISYRPFEKEQKQYKISPYILRQFNDRWFLIARINKCPYLTPFAIDRIENIEFSPDLQYIPCNIDDITKRFFSIYGISGAFDEELHLEELVLRVTSTRIGYIDTKPILPNSDYKIAEIPDRPGWYQLTIPEIVINKELMSLILSFGEDVEVVAPTSLRDRIKTILRNSIEFYSVK